MTLSGPWVPETEDERNLMEDIGIALNRADRSGVERERMAALLAFMASATLDPQSIEEPPENAQSLADRMQEESPKAGLESDTCPECGKGVDGWNAEIGGPVILDPCGCEITDPEQLKEL